MYYEIKRKQDLYKGWRAELCSMDLPLNNKKKASYILSLYFESIDLTFNKPPSKEGLEKLLIITQKLQEEGIPCEVVLCSQNYTDLIWDYPLQWLGMDIIYKECESIIASEINDSIKGLLNENGLLSNTEDCNRVINMLNIDPLDCELWNMYILKSA